MYVCMYVCMYVWSRHAPCCVYHTMHTYKLTYIQTHEPSGTHMSTFSLLLVNSHIHKVYTYIYTYIYIYKYIYIYYAQTHASARKQTQVVCNKEEALEAFIVAVNPHKYTYFAIMRNHTAVRWKPHCLTLCFCVRFVVNSFLYAYSQTCVTKVEASVLGLICSRTFCCKQFSTCIFANMRNHTAVRWKPS
jgi:hypothetical protein